jgi:acetylglutamate kinase
MSKITIVKIGGSTLGSHDTTIDDIITLQKNGEPPVVIHGGGKLITDWLKKLGLSSSFVRGERVTDGPTLEVVTSVLAGLVNKEIVASINERGGRAVGISGVDGTLIEGKIADPEKGYVGVAVKVNIGILHSLMVGGFVPVIAPLGLNIEKAQEDTPKTLNFNADVVAGEIAAAIDAQCLVFLTDVPGILDNSGHLMPRLTSEEARVLLDSGVAAGGMIPKVQACLRALSSAQTTWIVDGREPHALLKTIRGEYSGTTIRRVRN